ncbi:MAG TPA: hypothetical protein VEZ20_10120 [Allosphingosinicella sp.]|jgi:hypothetical protein|nr:hypothetical protein [Allosphingosinicella sp.]
MTQLETIGLLALCAVAGFMVVWTTLGGREEPPPPPPGGEG